MSLKSKQYVIVGSKIFQEKKLSEITDSLEEPEESVFYADELNPEEFFTVIFTMPLFSSEKLVVIKNAEKYKDICWLMEKSRKSESIIVFLFESINKKELKEAEENFTLIQETKKNKTSIINEITAMFNEKGFRLSKQIAEEIYILCNNDLSIVKNELEKVEIYFNYTKPEKETDILNIISSSRNESIFQFIDQFCNKNYKGAMSSLYRLIDAGENLDILYSMLFKRIQKIYLYKINPSLINEHTFVINKIKSNKKLWSNNELAKVIALFNEIDYKSKTGYKDETRGLINLLNLIAPNSKRFSRYP
ncbi:DNA polymerase III delta [Flexistipes sinusarabici DSM 4947]|uniref:DNA-directed DNA polymerase n=1 Tax=Flexistipes sinusarabici (strain ATCC 49648 / DSM 4947 / MAS 10) TaxID=717231 RepID=F8E7H1_FLESM|nr:DNA polymerase III delta [Flexistipes sinusarabici]AEI14958.1 DNA polymerase III delta [Flexistipes sinusarabici DSM 4947]